MAMLPTNNPDPKDHLLPPARASQGSGPIVGIVIILALLMVGGWYFLSTRGLGNNTPLPLILGDEAPGTTTTIFE